MSTIIRTLIRSGVLVFTSSAVSSITIGPAGMLIGPAITAAEYYINRSDLVESRQGLRGLSGNEILNLAMRVAFMLFMDNFQNIVQICKDIISLLRRFLTGEQNTSRMANVPLLERPLEIVDTMGSVPPVLVVHGGAGDIPDSNVQPKLDGVRKAAREGYKVLQKTGNVLDAIEAAIIVMEDDEAFNAGKGSILNLEGGIEMEALITEGTNFNAGGVTLVKNISHPISLARMVMEKTPHTFLGGDGVEEFIKKMGIPRVPETSLITTAAKKALEKFKMIGGGKPSQTELAANTTEAGVGTVGCVAVNADGHVASGTSTGGITGKYKGRIGDTPLPGSGGYSDDLIGAVSTTGHGESILRYNLAHRILTEMEKGSSAEDATIKGCEDMTKKVGNTAGAITVSNKGKVGIGFTSNRMAWAYQLGDKIYYGINPGEIFTENA